MFIEKIMEDLYTILDNYYAQLPIEAEESKSDKTWSIFLARMDMRKMDTSVTETEKGFELILDSKLSPELKNYSENSQKEYQNKTKYTPLWLWSKNKLENNLDYKKYKEFEENPLLALEQLKEIINIPQGKRDFILMNKIFPYISIVLLRDYHEQLLENDKILCKDILFHFSTSDGIGLAISFLPIVLNIFPELKDKIKFELLLHLFNDYPTDNAIHNYSIKAIIDFYSEKEIENFILGYLFLKPKYINNKNEFSNTYKEDIQNFINNKLTIEDIDFQVNITILSVVFKFIKFPKVKPNNIFKEVTKELLLKVFQPKEIEKNSLENITEDEVLLNEIFSGSVKEERFEDIDFRIKQKIFENLPHLIFKLDTNEAKEYLQPLLNNFRAREDIAYLLLDFIRTQDRLNEYNKFWNIWYLFEDKIIEICKDGEYSYTYKIIQTYLLAWSPYGTIWKQEAKEWHSLKEKDKRFFKRMSEKTGHCPSTLYSILKLLTGIGLPYLNEGIGWVSYIVKSNKNLLTDKLKPNTTFNLEIITRKYISQNSQEIKREKVKREEILEILNFLVEKGSAIGYMLRERIL